VDQSFTVARKTLTVTADDKSRRYDTANPTLTATLAGFVGGDTAAVVSGAAALSTTATLTSATGTYPITPALGTLAATNYAFTAFTPGTLTVAPNTQAITLDPIPGKTYGDAPFTVNATTSSRLTPAYTIASGPAKVVGNLVTLTGVGTVVVRSDRSRRRRLPRRRSRRTELHRRARRRDHHPRQSRANRRRHAEVRHRHDEPGRPRGERHLQRWSGPERRRHLRRGRDRHRCQLHRHRHRRPRLADSPANVAGTYFGTLGTAGTFAFYLRPDNTGTFLAFTNDARTAYRSRAVTVDSQGRFAFTTTVTAGINAAGDRLPSARLRAASRGG